ncbi:hypothetical protein CMV_010963 [Castanea mollissima]|uniref:Uncharacterized protein n=1 Tax=Castanea mollissima TaxID=60419 RepID=A0A8J4RE52_9ROSI|nr:hypothetical protein CMV_010963 [Castanea mollissima]
MQFSFILSATNHVLITSSLETSIQSPLLSWSPISQLLYFAKASKRCCEAHYVNEHWVLQKKVLSFPHMPPPRDGVKLSERLLGLLKEWGIEKRVFTITFDNVSYNNTLHPAVVESGLYDRHGDFFGFETYVSQLIGSDSSKSQLDLYLEEAQLNHRIHEDSNVLGFLLPQTTEALLCALGWLYGVLAIHDFEKESLVEDFGNLCLSQSSSYVDEDWVNKVVN